MNTKFDLLYENMLGRYQQGGYIVGDRVRFSKDALKHPSMKDKAEGFVNLIKSCMDDGFDKILRISALKSIHPTTTSGNFRGGTEAPSDIYADIVIETNPGLYVSPMTVSVGMLELQDDQDGRGPVPDSLKRKEKLNYPEKGKAKKTDGDEDEHLNNATKNTKLDHGNKWDDKKPGGGNFKA